MASTEDIILQDGVYGIRKKNGKFSPQSNCSLKFIDAVDAGDFSGYIGIATHKDGNKR